MTNPDRKPRADSVLKNLPAEKQAEIAEYAHTHSVRATAQWLADQAVTISHTEVAHFLHWHAMQQKLEKNDATWDALEEKLRQGNPRLNEREIDSLGLRYFAVNAIRAEDLRGFVALRKLALAREIYEFSAATACREDLPYLKAIEADAALTNAQKTQLFAEKIYGCPPEKT